VQGRVLTSFKEVCSVLGLLQNDQEWNGVLIQAALTHMCPQIRELFVTMLLFCQVSDPQQLFETHHMDWCDDFIRKNPIFRDPVLGRACVLLDIEKRLQVIHFNLVSFEVLHLIE